MSDEGMPLSDRQQEAALALADLWPGKDRDEVLARYFDLIRSPEAKRRMAEWRDRDIARIVVDGEIDPALAETRDLLLPVLLETEKRYQQMPRQWPGVFSRALGKPREPGIEDEGLERVDEVVRSGLAQLRPRRAPTTIDTQAGDTVISYYMQPVDLALGVRIKRAAIDDGSCLAGIVPSAFGLAESVNQSEEIVHANVLNTGDVYNACVGGDGCPLFGDHPIRDSVYSNACDLELNEAALEHAAWKVRNFPDMAGLRMFARLKKLIVPIELEFTASRLFRDGALSHLIPEGYQCLDFLRHPKSWFVQTTIPGLRSISRRPFRLDFTIDGRDLIMEAAHSFDVGYYNPRAIFASIPKEAA